LTAPQQLIQPMLARLAAQAVVHSAMNARGKPSFFITAALLHFCFTVKLLFSGDISIWRFFDQPDPYAGNSIVAA
jgi:hypothetical protein